MTTTDCPTGCECLCDPCVIFGTAAHHNTDKPDTVTADAVQQALESHWREAEHTSNDPFVVADIQVTLESVAASLGIRLKHSTANS